MTELTEDQKKFLTECETEFANRYTDEDKDFVQVKIIKSQNHNKNKTKICRSNKLVLVDPR